MNDLFSRLNKMQAIGAMRNDSFVLDGYGVIGSLQNNAEFYSHNAFCDMIYFVAEKLYFRCFSLCTWIT